MVCKNNQRQQRQPRLPDEHTARVYRSQAAKVGDGAKKLALINLNNDIKRKKVMLRMIKKFSRHNPNVETLTKEIAALMARQLRFATK
jgi:hypothetical protein